MTHRPARTGETPGASWRIRTAGRRVWAVAIAAAALAVPLVAAPASAQVTPLADFHEYAIGFDVSHGPYSGIGVTRNDISVTLVGHRLTTT